MGDEKKSYPCDPDFDGNCYCPFGEGANCYRDCGLGEDCASTTTDENGEPS